MSALQASLRTWRRSWCMLRTSREPSQAPCVPGRSGSPTRERRSAMGKPACTRAASDALCKVVFLFGGRIWGGCRMLLAGWQE